MKRSQLTKVITRTVGSNAALLRAMQRNNTPVAQRTLQYWLSDHGSIKVKQLVNLAAAMNIEVTDLVKSITIKNEGDE